jgi:hypothetical protein
MNTSSVAPTVPAGSEDGQKGLKKRKREEKEQADQAPTSSLTSSLMDPSPAKRTKDKETDDGMMELATPPVPPLLAGDTGFGAVDPSASPDGQRQPATNDPPKSTEDDNKTGAFVAQALEQQPPSYEEFLKKVQEKLNQPDAVGSARMQRARDATKRDIADSEGKSIRTIYNFWSKPLTKNTKPHPKTEAKAAANERIVEWIWQSFPPAWQSR